MSEVKQFHLREGTLVEGKSLGCLNVYLASDYDQLKADNEAYKNLHNWLKAENERLGEVIGSKNARIHEYANRHIEDFTEIEALRKQVDEARKLLEWINGYDKEACITAWLEANKP